MELTTIDTEIKVPIEILEFRYGSVVFSHQIKEINRSLEFEIEQHEIRPEFEVLKPYFAKALKLKFISVSIFAEFENAKLVSMSASSQDISKINREVIEAVRFRFFTKPLFGNRHINSDDEVNSTLQSAHPLYKSGESLLEEVLAYSQFKHHRQLRFLADRHAAHLLKVRFVLHPFSFVFLLEGEKEFHIILETLDTEEASYLWHFEKQISELPKKLSEIDAQLDNIRKNGRQKFLAAPPGNFNRIVHDYSDEMKGFIIWKSLLEEQLT